MTQFEQAKKGIITQTMHQASQKESVEAEFIRAEVAAGRMVIPANKIHLQGNLQPIAIGRAVTTKINANIGASPLDSDENNELSKLEIALKYGADTVMDLSTGGDVDHCRCNLIEHSPVPLGTVPLYEMIINKPVEQLTYDDILATCEKQARQGVDFFTIHAGVLKEHLPLLESRIAGIVSRGGSLLARWMLHHNRQNPFYEIFDELCDIMQEYDVCFSLGDGLRPGCLADATDKAQIAELRILGELTRRAWEKGCQVMVEGPGHVPFDQIEYNMKIQKEICQGAPFYVLGPLVTDIAPGYDHITSAIGATAAAYHGAAFLCYVTPREHLGLPTLDDVRQGVIAYKIAAHSADVALGIKGARDRDDQLSRARANLDWSQHLALALDPETARKMHDEKKLPNTDYCTMCGKDWCSVRISKEVKEIAQSKSKSQENKHRHTPS
ncbi:MAG: phosphomethylpyrimidine synthase ThiC [Sedimentisphaerales bacterium]|nr:phosphomethylpyrimidine synthase ThiC [Sedimentisphaerales bacterium]